MKEQSKEKKFKGKGPAKEEECAKDRKSYGRKYDKRGKGDKPYLKGPNDINWRTSDTVMTELAARLPFGLSAGLREGDLNVGPGATYDTSFIQPGILSIPVLLTGGPSKDYNSPLNLAVRKIYSYVRHANAGSKNYEAVDIGLYCMSIAQVLGLLGFMQRLLRVVNDFSTTNRYMPKYLLRAMGVDYDDIKSNQARLKYDIAWLGRAIGSLAFPDMPYFHACYEAFKYIYRDNDSPKEQFYLITPYKLGIYNPTYDSNGGGMAWNGGYIWQLPNTTTPMKLTDIENYMNERIDVLLGDEDCGIISGDILKAFKDGGLFTPTAFGDDYDVFQHSPEVLEQFHNARVIRGTGMDFVGYKQNPGSTNTAPFIEHDFNATVMLGSDAARATHYLTIDAFSREPDAKEVINCTVMQPVLKIKIGTAPGVVPPQFQYDWDSAAFDLFLPVNAYMFVDIDDANTNNPVDLSEYLCDCSTYFAIASMGTDILRLTNFDWHPLIKTYRSSSLSNPGLQVTGDIQNFRIFSLEVSKRIHECSLLSLLNFKELNFIRTTK